MITVISGDMFGGVTESHVTAADQLSPDA